MKSLVTNIQGYSIHDGPGIRTVVFLKGCGLECQWCSNPECISPVAEIGFVKKLCTQCGKCADVCPIGALDYKSDKLPHIDRTRCNGCGLCSSVCSYQALVLYGKAMTTEEIFTAVNQDKMFYDTSGGGVTVSGGEALLQPDLVLELFTKCRQAGINTCIETSGFAPEASLKKVLPHTDFILYDLKLMNPEQHHHFTGQSNERILSNAKIVVQSGVAMLFRMPLVPGINDNESNIKATADFLMSLGNSRVELMPYHRLGKGKYESLDKPYPSQDIRSPEPEHLEAIRKMFESKGITCTISK